MGKMSTYPEQVCDVPRGGTETEGTSSLAASSRSSLPTRLHGRFGEARVQFAFGDHVLAMYFSRTTDTGRTLRSSVSSTRLVHDGRDGQYSRQKYDHNLGVGKHDY